MKRISVFLLLLWGLALPAWADDISGTINTYVKGSGDVAKGATTIIYTGLFRGAGTSISPGDQLLIIQSQGADIISSNTDQYGDGVGTGATMTTTPTSLHGTAGYAGGLISQTAGTFEYVTVASVFGTQVTLTSGLEHAYSNSGADNWQIIVVPDYGLAGATLIGNITGVPWDGDTGGVIAFNATGGIVDFNGFNVNAAGIGFRGGVELYPNFTIDNIADVVVAASYMGGKGEGIAGTPRYVYDGSTTINEGSSTLPGGDFGRGAPGNAGGGAGPHNSGGGGGSNAGAGGTGAQGWVVGTAVHFAGYGGQSIFAGANMGGGGGSGEANDSGPTYGGVGGGVILIRADSASGTGMLDVSGAQGTDATELTNVAGDGAGGGGAGGTVFAYFSSPTTLTGLDIDASGGRGGNASPEHGGGGGGGAGLVVVNATVGTVNTSGGAKGANEGLNGVASEPGGDSVADTGFGAFARLNTDYGDAPDTYGTISGAGGAYHYFADYDFNGVLGTSEKLRLGANLDGEGSGNPSTAADSDDSTGLDDEDGVSGLSSIDMGQSSYTISASSITVTNTLATSATLHAWIDFDQNGTFDNDEYTSISVARGLTEQNPSSDLVWSAMPGITSVTAGSTTYLRLRLTTDSSIDATKATGAANNGEVEDHTLSVIDPSPTPVNVTRSNPVDSLTNADQLVFAVTFSENVQSVDISDFSVSGAGSSGATVSAVSGSGSSYTVTVDVANTDGAVNLAIAATTGIQDLTGNNLSTVTPTGTVESYTLDNTAPLVATIIATTASTSNEASYLVSGTCTTGEGDVTVSIAGATPASQAASCNAGSWSTTFDVSAISDGNNVIAVNASQTDTAGNIGNATLVEADKDTLAPVVATTSVPMASTLNQASFPVGGTCTTGDGDVTVSIAGAAPASQMASCSTGSWSATFDVSGIGDGSGVIAVNASQTDTAGNIGNATLIEADKDTLAPVVATTSVPMASTLNQASFPVGGTCTTGDGDVTVSIAGAAPASQMASCSAGSWSATFDVSAIGDGSNVIAVNASQTDTAGNIGNATLVEADKDSTAPDVATTSAPMASTSNQASYPVSGTCTTGEGDVTVSITGAAPASQAASCSAGSWNATFDVSAISDGNNVIAVNASQTDIAGNIGNATLVEADKDTLAPVVATTSVPMASTLNQASFPVGGTCTTGDGDVTVSIAGAAPASQTASCSTGSWSATFDVSGIGDGSGVIAVNASQTDTAGNIGNATLIEADKDTLAPVVATTSVPMASTLNQASFPVGGTCTTGDGDVTVSIAGAAPASQTASCSAGSWSATFDVSAIGDGSNVIAVNASQTDTAGNIGNATLVEADKDSTAPDVATISAPVASTSNQASYPVSGTCTIGDGDVTVSIAGATPASQAASCSAGSWNATFDVSAISDGNNVIAVNASQTDTAGNIGNATQVQAGKDTVGPSTSILNAPGGIVDQTPYTVTFEFSDDVTGFESGDIVVVNGSLSNFTAVNGNTYTAVITPSGAGDVTIDVPGNVTQDSLGNPNLAAVQAISLQSPDSDGDGIPDSVECPSGPPFDGTTCASDDTDGDGTPDFIDPDSDNDGIPDSEEAGPVPGNPIDTDGDGDPDYQDVDSDGDTISDTVEAGADPGNPVDTDVDGVEDFLDLDSDNDGIPDAIEGNVDSDSDGVADYLDLDSDNDGLYDLVESGADYAALDTLNDGTIDVTNTVGSNGLADAVETTADSGTLNYNGGSALDSDADGVEDYVDLDSDNDGLTDVYEAGGSDDNGDGIVGSVVPATVDAHGVPTVALPLTPIDTDGDGVNDQIDLDTDNDGIMDVVEFGGDDPDGDGQIGTAPSPVDANGLSVDGSLPEVDIDGDGVPNQKDLDSDNDGIPDVTEAGGDDPDGDGIAGTGAPTVNDRGIGNGIILNPDDVDGDSILDPYDPDSDGDGIFDLVEAGGPDADNDGKVDDFDDPDGDGFDDGIAAVGLPLPDSDGDGIPDYKDIRDTDNDGLPDTTDEDDDNDGIPDIDEGDGARDTDGDGIDDSRDLDSDNDGIPDAIEGNVDSDSDGVADYLDLDSDNDGLYDLVESGADYATLDTLNDGTIDVTNTVGSNGLADAVETSADSGTLNYNGGSALDSDADGVEDYVDLDSDNDGLTDVYEAGGSDDNGDGIVGSVVPATVDADGVPTVALPLTPIDTDGDGVNDQIDLDTDNDGIMDVVEFGGDDPDGDGQIGTAPAQVNSNGLSIDGSRPELDTDGDGVPNQKDLDSDNDGIPDVTEAGGDDPDFDGIAGSDVPAVNTLGVGIILNPDDIDGDTLLDPYDLDSDGDGIFDLVEGGGPDTDNDGMVDGFDDPNGDGFDDGITSSPLPLPDTDGDGIPDYKDNDDTDNDGIPDNQDVDDDNDGIPDDLEGDGSIDTDGDGVPDSRDLDSDNDGLYDLYEVGIQYPALMDLDNDGRIDSTKSVGANGFADNLETTLDSGSINYNGGTLLDTDGDIVKDFRDLDSDNDSIPDVIEAGGGDGDGDGILGNGTPAVNNNGIATGSGQGPRDTDADGTPDHQDRDSDGDGEPDLQEAGGPDSDDNGEVDSFDDSNGDGFDDTIAAAPRVLPDTDGDGIPDYRDVPDAPEVTKKITAGLDGIGAFNFWILALLTVLAGLRQIRGVAVAALSVVMLLLMQGEAVAQQTAEPEIEAQAEAETQQDDQQHFYVGAGIGTSTLQPETSGSGYSLDEDTDSGTRLYIGMDLTSNWSVELSVSDLGAVTFKPTGTMEYKATALNALYYLYNESENDHVGMGLYLKAGLAKLDVTSDIPYELGNSSQLSLGGGLEYAWENGFAVRADVESFDADAKLFTLGLLYRFGKSEPEPAPEPIDSDGDGVFDDKDQCPQTPAGSAVDAVGCELDSDGDGVVDSKDQCPQTPAGLSVDAVGCELDSDGDGVVNSKDQCLETPAGAEVDHQGCTRDSDNDGVDDIQDQCPTTPANVKVDENGCSLDSDGDGVLNTLDQCPDTIKGAEVNATGCAMFETTIEGVNFRLASDELTGASKLILDNAASEILKFPSVIVEVQAHTDSQGTIENNQNLSDRRAQSVVDYLVTRGVPREALVAKGYGETSPAVSNRTPEGRAKNRRVELRVISAVGH